MKVLLAIINFLPWVPCSAWKVGDTVGPYRIKSKSDADELLTLHVFVKHSDDSKETLSAILDAVSDPFSSEYGRHLSFETISELMRPPAEHLDAARAWLSNAGIDWSSVHANPSQDILELTVSVGTAEALLNVSYFTLQSIDPHASFTSLTRCAPFELAYEIQGFIDTVGPTFRLPSPMRLKLPPIHLTDSNTTIATEPNAIYTTPPDLRSRYGATGLKSAATNNSFAVTGFLDQYFTASDIAYFFKTYDTLSVGHTAKVVGPNIGASGPEATIDVSYGMGMALGVPTTFWSTPGRMPGHLDNEPFLQWLTDVSNTPNAPLVFSISYSDNEDTVDLDYAIRVNVELQKAGVRGISVIDSSGDGGVGGTMPDTTCTKFMATFPAASPYVTAVGGTGGTAGAETASTVFASGGGFSSWWDPPSYQTSAIASYLAFPGVPNAKLFNSSGAGFPDVSLHAETFALTQYSVSVPVSGTSCSAPSFAGLVSQLNAVRLGLGKSPLGWLNPLLYAHPEAFTDITKGNNPGCAKNPALGYTGNGFPAAPGWDPLTGLGTPLMDQWVTIVSALP